MFVTSAAQSPASAGASSSSAGDRSASFENSASPQGAASSGQTRGGQAPAPRQPEPAIPAPQNFNPIEQPQRGARQDGVAAQAAGYQAAPVGNDGSADQSSFGGPQQATFRGSNIQLGATLTVNDAAGVRTIEDGADGRVDGVLTFDFDLGEDLSATFAVDNYQAPDFTFKFSPGGAFEPTATSSDAIAFAPEVTLNAADGGNFDFRANLSKDQIAHYNTVTNNNLIGNSGSRGDDPANGRFAQRLQSGEATSQETQGLFNRVEAERANAIQNASVKLDAVVNDLRDMGENGFFPSEGGADPSSVQRQNFNTVKRLASAAQSLEQKFGDYNQAVQAALAKGVDPQRLIDGVTNGRGEAGIKDFEAQVKQAADGFYKQAADLVAKNEKVLNDSVDARDRKQAMDAIQSVLGLATGLGGLANTAFTTFRSLGKLGEAGAKLATAKGTRDTAMKTLLENGARRGGRIRARPEDQKALKAAQDGFDAELKAHKDAVKDFGQQVYAQAANINDTAATAKFVYHRHENGQKGVKGNAEAEQRFAALMSQGDSSGLREGPGYKAFAQNVGGLLARNVAYTPEASTNSDDFSSYSEYEDNQKDFAEIPAPQSHKDHVQQNIKKAEELNRTAKPGERYFVVDERFSRGLWKSVAFHTRIAKVSNWPISDYKGPTRIGNNPEVFEKLSYRTSHRPVGRVGFQAVQVLTDESATRVSREHDRYVPSQYDPSKYA